MKPHVILQLEKELNTHFEETDSSVINKFQYNRFSGFAVREDYVVGLSIMHHDLEQLPSTLAHKNLLKLEYLNLDRNNIKTNKEDSKCKLIKKINL